MKNLERILEGNKNFAKRTKEQDPDFFNRLVKEQKPNFLWIGCSDSRVPANEVTDTDPGEIFVHRNIANLVVISDLNLMSVLQYAVEYLGVGNIIVCGHTGCGGVKAAMTSNDFGVLNRWFSPIKDIYIRNVDLLEKIEDTSERANKLGELVTIEQIYNIAKTSVIQRAWKEKRSPLIHACMYDMATGEMHVLKTISADNTKLPEIYTIYDWD